MDKPISNIAEIYYDCFTKNIDRTNRIIANDEKCLVPTSRAFWKYIEDIPAGVRTQPVQKAKGCRQQNFQHLFSR